MTRSSKGARVVTGGKRAAAEAGRFFEPTVLADVDHSMRCMTEETFGPTLPVMRVGDARGGGAARQRRALWPPGLGVDPRHGERRADRPPGRGRGLLRQRRPAQLRRARAADGRLEGVGAGLPARTGRDPQVREAAVADDHPGLRAAARAAHVPVLGARSPSRWAMRSALLATSELFTDAQRRTLLVLCDTLVPSLPPPSRTATRTTAGIPTASGRAPPRTSAIPEAIEVALLGSAATEEQLAGLGSLLDSLGEQGMVPEAPLEAREQLIHAFSDSGPEALAGIAHASRPDAVALLRPSRPRHRAEPELGRDRLSGAPAPAPRGAEAARRSPARGRGRGDDDRGRRLRGRLRGRRRRDRRDPRRGRQAGLRARAGRLLQRGRLQPARGLGLPEPLPARRADPHGRGPGLDPGRLVAGRRHGDQLAELPADLPLGARAVGARARPRGPRRPRLRPLPRPGDASGSASPTRARS